MYASTAKLMSQLRISKAKARYWLTGSASCVILDDFCMQPLDTQSRGILMDIIDDRHQRRSTMITLYQSKTGTT